MADIYERSVSRAPPGVTFAKVKKLIRDAISKISSGVTDVKETVQDSLKDMLNLVEVDPDDIVVLGDNTDKLKTSNVSLGDILVKQRGGADNAIAVFSNDGGVKPGVLVSTITDKLSEYDRDFDDHEKNYNNFRQNVVSKFFGSPITVTPSIEDIKAFIDNQALVNTSTVEKLDKVKKHTRRRISAISCTRLTTELLIGSEAAISRLADLLPCRGFIGLQ